MRRARRAAIVAIALVLVAGALIYSERRSGSAATLVGVVRATEIRVEPEVDGQLMSIAVEKGVHVHAGERAAGACQRGAGQHRRPDQERLLQD